MSVAIILQACVSLGLFASFFTQFSANLLRQLRTARQDRTIRERTQAFNRRIAKLARLESQIGVPQNNHTSPAWRVMEVREVKQESEDCKSFYLVDPHGEVLPDYSPGQYLMVRPALASSKQLTRCYSLSESPHKNYWRITVKKHNSHSEGRPGSSHLSVWLHEQVGVGDCLLVGGPAGQFYLPSNLESPLVLLAAGVGITPIVSMLRWSLEHSPNRPIMVLFQARDAEHWPFGKQLHSWQSQCRCLRVISYFSRASSEQSRERADSIRIGKFGAADIAELFEPWIAADYFLCGPDSWMSALRIDLVGHGVAERQIHWESFGGPPAKRSATEVPDPTRPSAVTPCKINFSLSQSETDWSEPEQTLWELARSSGVEIASGCLSGACGSCRVRVLKGKVEYTRVATAEIGDDECLTCIARPKSDLVLEA